MSDLALALTILFGIILGWRSGFINVLGRLGAIVIGFIAARNFSADVAVAITERVPSLAPPADGSSLQNLLSMFINTEVIANRLVQILAFIIIFIVVSFVVRKVCQLISGVFSGSLLGTINRALGAFLGFIFFTLIAGICIEIFLPVFANTSWGASAMTFFAESKYVLPFVNSLAGFFISSLPDISTLLEKLGISAR